MGADSFQGLYSIEVLFQMSNSPVFSSDPLASKLGTCHLLTTMILKQMVQCTENWAWSVVKMS